VSTEILEAIRDIQQRLDAIEALLQQMHLFAEETADYAGTVPD
jgi:hypothetical protein